MCLVAIASISFTLRILQGVRLVLSCGEVDFIEVSETFAPGPLSCAIVLRSHSVARLRSNRYDAVQWRR